MHKNIQKVLTPIVTLARLAAEGKFASVDLMLPESLMLMNPNVTLNGEPFTRFITEIYAPGDETGYVLAYPYDRNAGIELIKGNFAMNWTEYED